MEISAELRSALHEAFVAADPLVALYLDTQHDDTGEMRVVSVRDGVCSVPDLTADEVEQDEVRFLEIPVIPDSTDYVWMCEFVDEQDDERIGRHLDMKKGANKRFLAGLPQAGDDAVAAWKAFRKLRLDAAVNDWLAELS